MLDVAVRTRLSISLVFVRTIRWKLVLLLSRIFSGGYVTDCLNDNAPMNYYRATERHWIAARSTIEIIEAAYKDLRY